MTALLALVALGFYAYSRQATEGLVVTGLRDLGPGGGAAWGLYIAFDVYFVGVSFAGITMAALIRLLQLERLRVVARIAETLTVIALLLAALSVLPDLGQPLRGIVNLFRYARPQSPFFGTFTLVIAGYLFASLVYLYLDGRQDAALCARTPGPFQWFHRLWAAGYRDTPAERERHERTSFWLAIAIVPLLVTAHSTLGFVFGLQVGRPGWFSALQAPAFVILAGVSGVGLLAVVAALLRTALGEQERLGPEIFRWLGTFLMVLIAAYLYFMIVEWLTTMYAGHTQEVRVTLAMLAGRYAWIYWTSVAALVGAFVVVVLPALPAPVVAWLPAGLPRLARPLAAAAIVAAGVLIVQLVPAAHHVGLTLPPPVWTWLPRLLIVLVALVVLSILPVVRTNVVAGTTTAGLLVNVAAIGKRYLIVVPSQTHGSLLPYGTGAYAPTWVEYGVILGVAALGALLFALFARVFPLLPVELPGEGRSH
ncbi:MAG: NrfD/PsrC family molybdoenzyme membrane anchor subunit [Armatimonadota bacterium]|nr:NrfD/PsrC family molybdoenzyme membrane anchor subunit [Armatimonadota bacterium]MDR7486322.1 NrfD/PsrC family molybdoenzyme membrane anchor subunit [Armatimonadota bacterium]MDR7532297.1 NrfD/PsrC family molybdoenzyme membrane anchor subunit [Armatimonadota bacterium]MDR7537230.1 NrfD/PsrC family molybdoenzyme membrane anchor subunit [Armatimonadota bacterium]